MSSPSNAIVALVALALVLDPRPIKPIAPAWSPGTPRAAESDACALLTEEQVSAAIEAKALAGKHLVPSSTKQCIWSDDPNHGTDHRRVTLNIAALRSFDLGKSNPGLTTEAVSGVGDAAYYIIYKADAPTIVVRKGDSVFNLRILNGLKFKALTLEEEKARELSLAKAAAAKI